MNNPVKDNNFGRIKLHIQNGLDRFDELCFGNILELGSSITYDNDDHVVDIKILRCLRLLLQEPSDP